MIDRAPGATSTGRSFRRQAAAFPEALRLPISQPRLAAYGLRARAHQLDERTLHVELDGCVGRITIEPPLADGPVAAWPFGTARSRTVGGRADNGRDVLVAAPDLPAVVLVREGHTETTVRADDSAGIGVSLEQVDDARCLIVVRPADADVPDAETLIAAAVARARRRAARAPFMTGDDGLDPIRAADYELRRTLRRIDAGVFACDAAGAPLPPTEQATAIMALCALNDVELAAELLSASQSALSANGALATLIVGAWAGWRGTVPERDEIRAAAQHWMEQAEHSADSASVAALALAPVAAEALGVQALVTRLRAGERPAARIALPQFAASVTGSSVGALLEFLHAEMGIEPDALRGRIVIAPLIRAGQRDVEQVSLGDALLAVRMNADAGGASIEVEQTSGATPVTIVLEPGVPAARLRSARVDDTAAELDSVADESGLRVKVQLVVDQPRRLDLRYEL